MIFSISMKMFIYYFSKGGFHPTHHVFKWTNVSHSSKLATSFNCTFAQMYSFWPLPGPRYFSHMVRCLLVCWFQWLQLSCVCLSCDTIMSTMASQITSLTIFYSIVYSGADQRKLQSSALLAFVQGIHRWLLNSPHKGPVSNAENVSIWWLHHG